MATTRKPNKPTAASKPAGRKTAADMADKRSAPASTRMTPQTGARTSSGSKPAASKVAAKKAVVAKKTSTATSAKKATTKNVVVQKSTAARKPAPAPGPIKTASAKPSSKPASPKPASPKPAAAAKPSKPKSARSPQMITADQALANTRALLQAKQAQAQQPTPYPTSDPGHQVHGGFMSHNAAETNQERHFDEANSPAIQGHVAAQVRSEQGKRDKR